MLWTSAFKDNMQLVSMFWGEQIILHTNSTMSLCSSPPSPNYSADLSPVWPVAIPSCFLSLQLWQTGHCRSNQTMPHTWVPGLCFCCAPHIFDSHPHHVFIWAHMDRSWWWTKAIHRCPTINNQDSYITDIRNFLPVGFQKLRIGHWGCMKFPVDNWWKACVILFFMSQLFRVFKSHPLDFQPIECCKKAKDTFAG